MHLLKLKKLAKDRFSKLDYLSVDTLINDYCLSEQDAIIAFNETLRVTEIFNGSIELTENNHHLHNIKEIGGNLLLYDVNHSIPLFNCLKYIKGDIIIRSTSFYNSNEGLYTVYFNDIIIGGTIRIEPIIVYSSTTISLDITINYLNELPEINVNL